MLKLKKAEQMYRVFKELEKVAKEFQKVNELYCMIDTPNQKLLDKEIALREKAKALADKIGLHAVPKRDPRGSSLFLTGKENKDTLPSSIEEKEKLYLEY